MLEHPDHWRRASAVRALAIDAVEAANSGHPGMPMGMADVATTLFEKHLKFDASDSDWPDRDRFVLSAGHGSMLLYALLYLTGYPDFTVGQLKNFRQLGSLTAGHPEYGHGKGVETTTGPLGQGLANAVGMAIAEEYLRGKFGSDIISHRTYTIAGDGCLMEGISHEAAALAGKLRLSRLVILFDDNRISIDGSVSLSDITDQLKRFIAYGWNVLKCDGHDPNSIDAALGESTTSRKPTLIACRTEIGFGSPAKQGTAGAHGSPLGAEEAAAAKTAYLWPYKPFEIPPAILNGWREIGLLGTGQRMQWEQRREAMPRRLRLQFDRMMRGDEPARLASVIAAAKRELSTSAPSMATRKSSEFILSRINPLMPEAIGGSADLTGSNNTKTPDLNLFTETRRRGRYIHYGVREHAMAAAMNGMSLHGGIRPYGGTFLCFTDYARPSMRLSALMRLPVTYVMTHDSIGLGEDGPTHQPVEHLAMLRATPNLNVIRPCDAVETAEAWQLAVTSRNTPTVLALTRQGLPTLRTRHRRQNLTALGAYVIADSVARREVLFLATGSEVSIAMEARRRLEEEGIGVRVVSMPCWELFAAQEESYRRKILPRNPVRVAIEAGVRQGWDRWLCGERGRESKSVFIGMTEFGASAPGKVLYEHFAITADAAVESAKALL
ncbi:MAG: transketolase [Rhodobacteraceae bacterium]|nr:transketolase [Paracoccaceae bacterium]